MIKKSIKDIKKKKITNCSVLIPTYNRLKLLNDCLKSLSNQNVLPKEIIILEQGEKHERFLKRRWEKIFFPTRVIYKYISPRGRARALNEGVKIATTPVIAIIDDDCYADPFWIYHLNQTLIKTKKTIITGQVLPGKLEKNSTRVRDYVIEEKPRIYKRSLFTPIFILSGANCCFYKKDFHKVGPFNELLGVGAKFRSADDVEWGYRVFLKGYKVHYQPRAKIIHRSWKDEAEDIKTMENYGYGVGAFLYIVLRKGKINDFFYYCFKIFWWLFREIIRSKGLSKRSIPYWKYLFFAFVGFFSAMREKRLLRNNNFFNISSKCWSPFWFHF